MAVSFSYQYPSSTNVIIPSYDGIGAGKLIVDFAKNAKDFLVNQMVTQTPVTQLSGYWKRFDPAEVVRIADDPAAYAFQDGQEFPTGAQEKQRFVNVPYAISRVGLPYPIGYMERDQSPEDVGGLATNILGVKLMNLRTQKFYSLVTNTSNYYTANTFTVSTAVGTASQTWANGTSSQPNIRMTFNYISEQISLKSNGLVNGEDVVCLISPQVARAMSRSAEIIDYIKQTPNSWDEIRGNAPNQNKNYSIPDQLYGIKVVIDSTVVNYGPRGTDAREFFAPENGALFLCKPGVIKAQTPATSFSSVHFFTYAPMEMLLESWDQPWNKRILYQGIDMMDAKFVSPETSFYVTQTASLS